MNTESNNKLTFYTCALNCVAVGWGIKCDAQNKITCGLFAKPYLGRPVHLDRSHMHTNLLVKW